MRKILSLFLLVSGCTSPREAVTLDAGTDAPPDAQSPDAQTDAAVGLPVRALGDWESCSWIPGSADGLAQCAIATLPLDHHDPRSADFRVLVKRRGALDEERAQYWLLHGGPGDSAIDDMATLSEGVLGARRDLAIYAVDHRGIGGSGRLSCAAESASSEAGGEITASEWSRCLDEVRANDTLSFLTTTQAALDVAALIDVLRGDGTRVFVYGGSYGTYLAHRYLALRPDQPTGVILEGIADPRMPFNGYDATIDRVSHRLFDVCAATPDCRSHFDRDPWALAESVVARFAAGTHCPEAGLDADAVRKLFGTMAFYDELRRVLPALVTRLDRCTPTDVSRVTRFTSVLGSLSPERGNLGTGDSQLLGLHVALSELFSPDATPAELGVAWRALTMSTGVEFALATSAALGWPTYERDAYVGVWAEYDGPLLMLQGGLDPATSAERASAYRAHFDATYQTYVEFAEGAHQVRERTRTDAGDCATSLVHAFIEAPDSALDVACVAAVPPLSFDGDPALNGALFGTANAWND